MQLSRAGPGHFFGEASLLKNVPCAVTVRVDSPCLALCFHRTAFHALVSRIESMRVALSRYVESCTPATLKQFDAFSCLPPELSQGRLDTLASQVLCCTLNPGESLFTPNDMQDSAFLISQVRVCHTITVLSTVHVAHPLIVVCGYDVLLLVKGIPTHTRTATHPRRLLIE